MGIAFPMAEVISTYIPPSFYEAFYLYLYFGSMIFLVYMYAMLFRDNKTKPSESMTLWEAYFVWSPPPSSTHSPRRVEGNIDPSFTEEGETDSVCADKSSRRSDGKPLSPRSRGTFAQSHVFFRARARAPRKRNPCLSDRQNRQIGGDQSVHVN